MHLFLVSIFCGFFLKILSSVLFTKDAGMVLPSGWFLNEVQQLNMPIMIYYISYKLLLLLFKLLYLLVNVIKSI